jgi:hypothetical protein
VPETKVTLRDMMSLRGLVLQVQDHYHINKLTPPDDLEAIIEDFICAQMPEGICEGGPARKPRRLDYFSVLKATELLLRRTITSANQFFVPLPDASRRAEICANCPKNLLHMCTTCNGLRTTFRRLVANRTTSFDDRLGVCEACGCGLQAKVHISKQFLPPMPEDTKDTVPKNCWAL